MSVKHPKGRWTKKQHEEHERTRGPGVKVGDTVQRKIRDKDGNLVLAKGIGKVLWVTWKKGTPGTKAIVGVAWQSGLTGVHEAKELAAPARYKVRK